MMKKFSLFILVFFMGFFVANPVFALSKEDIVKTAFRDMVDRDPYEEELQSELDNFRGYDKLKSLLNAVPQREEAIVAIYWSALKRNPRNDEIEALKRFGAPSNLIRKSLFESKERELALLDAYRGLIGREPRQDELDFYVNTRASFDKIKDFLNSHEERIPAIKSEFFKKLSRYPLAQEVSIILENQTYLSVSTGNEQPLAIAEGKTVSAGTKEVILDATNSIDYLGKELFYHWKVLSTPNGIAASIQNPDSGKATLNLSVNENSGKAYLGTYEIQLIVDNNVSQSEALKIFIEVVDFSELENYLLELTNELRAKEGEPGAEPLSFNQSLIDASRGYSDYMLENIWFDHADKEGNHVDKRARDEGYIFKNLGENLGIIKTNSRQVVIDKEVVESLFQSWKESPDHYRNMISAKFKEMGAGFSIGEVDDSVNPLHIYATVNFGTQL